MDDMLFREFGDQFPHTLTILCTYRCTAACEQCCFESSPRIKGRLELEQIISRIDEAHRAFKGLKVVVFSGGEAFLLKDDLYAAIRHATSLGLFTRVVSNAYWGRTEKNAERVVEELVSSRLTEINLSTGSDHERWVPQESIVNAVRSLTARKIPTLITIEAETADSRCFERLVSRREIQDALKTETTSIQRNAWMPFKTTHLNRTGTIDDNELRSGCGQIFKNTVVTPHNNISACCGLTLEHIPEMRLGTSEHGLEDSYRSQFNDFLKYWISVDGPYQILENTLGADHPSLKDITHICQACVLLHSNEHSKARIRDIHRKHASSVLARFGLSLASTRARPLKIMDEIV